MGENMDYLMLVLASLLLAVYFSINKVYQKQNGTSLRTASAFNSLIGLFTAIIFFGVNGFKINVTWYSLIMATIYATLIMVYTVLSFKLLKEGSMALYTLFLMTGGMLLPYVFGLIFLNEPFSWPKTIGLVVIMSGVVLSNLKSKSSTNATVLILCLIVFVLNGFVSITSKLHQSGTTFPTVNTNEFVVLTGLVKFVVAGFLFLISKKDGSEATEKRPNAILLIIVLTLASAVVQGISSSLQLMSAIKLPASVLYPFITGGTIIFSSISGVILFKDKVSKQLVISIALCFIGTLLFL